MRYSLSIRFILTTGHDQGRPYGVEQELEVNCSAGNIINWFNF